VAEEGEYVVDAPAPHRGGSSPRPLPRATAAAYMPTLKEPNATVADGRLNYFENVEDYAWGSTLFRAGITPTVIKCARAAPPPVPAVQ
jgi:hypothetical protein